VKYQDYKRFQSKTKITYEGQEIPNKSGDQKKREDQQPQQQPPP